MHFRIDLDFTVYFLKIVIATVRTRKLWNRKTEMKQHLRLTKQICLPRSLKIPFQIEIYFSF